jgi:hypothetical protein
MARLLIKRVRKQLESICAASQAVKHLLQAVLTGIEENPSAFPELERIPERIRAIPGVTVRKARITRDPHDYRLVFLHFRPDGGEEWAEVIYAFRRRDGYPVDWDSIEGLREGP